MPKLRSTLHEVAWQLNNLACSSALLFSRIISTIVFRSLISSNRSSKRTELYWNSFKACFLNRTFTFCAILNRTTIQALALQPALWGIYCLVLLPSPCNDSACTYHSALFVKPQQWPTPSESIAIYCVRKLVSCGFYLNKDWRCVTHETSFLTQ